MKKALALLLLLFVAGCTDATRSQLGGYGSRHKIELYSGGVKVREWISTGKVNSVERSDGWYFEDEATRTNVEVTGTVVITRL